MSVDLIVPSGWKVVKRYTLADPSHKTYKLDRSDLEKLFMEYFVQEIATGDLYLARHVCEGISVWETA